MKKLHICFTILVVAVVLITSCQNVRKIPEESEIDDPQSTLLHLLMMPSDVDDHVDWSYNKIYQKNTWQVGYNVEFAERYLEGQFNEQAGRILVLVRHDLYAYKSGSSLPVDDLMKDSRYIGSNPKIYPISLFDSPTTIISECATYDKYDYQDCVVISEYSNLTSAVWFNFSRKVDDADVHQIITPLLEQIDKRIVNSEFSP